jgi:putative phosphoesterase
MKIGVISDTHDKIERTAEAIRLLSEQGAELLLHCGDICRPATVLLFSEVPTHFVFGNNDSSEELKPAISAIGAFYHREFGHLTLAGKEIAWVHSHHWKLLDRLERSGEYDFLFYGHTHEAESHRTGTTLVANPGALHRARPKTCLLIDLASGDLRTIEVFNSR